MRIASFVSRFVMLGFLVLLAGPALIAEQVVAVEQAATNPAPQSVQQMRENLQVLDQRLRLRLLRIVQQRPSVESAAVVSEEEIQRFRRHLRFLEGQLRAWGDAPEVAPGEAATLIKKVQALMPLVRNLERAAEHPETAAAGLAGLRRALRVEWGMGQTSGLKAATGDDCADAIPIGDGTFFGDTTDATPDGEGCFSGSPDVWFAYSSPVATQVVADTFGSGFDTVLSVHTDCPGTVDNEIACNDDTLGVQSAVSFQAQAGERYLIRVAGCCGDGGATGPFTLNIGPGGVIAGTVTDDVTGEPVVGAFLDAYNVDGFFVGSATTGQRGDYEVPGLMPGTHFIAVTIAEGYLGEIYDDVPCNPLLGCDPRAGTPIVVAPGPVTGGIDFTLERGGSLSGTVTETTTDDAIANLEVVIWNSHGNSTDYAHTNAAGHYAFTGLYAGTYFVSTRGSLHVDELYDNLPCPPFAEGCDPTTGTPIEVGAGATTDGIDFVLEQLGTIAGAVSDAVSGLPLSSAFVSVWDENGLFVNSVGVDAAGAYEVGGLPAGNYFVTTDDLSYFDELYDNLPCESSCDPTTGTRVEVSLNTTTSGIDFALEKLGVISGTVTRRVTGEPIFSDVYIWDDLGYLADFTFADSEGNYVSNGLLAGSYTATAGNLDHVVELYDDIPCPQNACDLLSGTPIAVSLNTVTGGIDFALERLAAISGRVTHVLTGEPAEHVLVQIYGAAGDVLGSGPTNESGHYLIRGLVPGSHFAVASGSEYLSQLYDGIPCDGCEPTSGTPIATSLNTVTIGVDFALDRLGSIAGRVVHADQPVVAAHVLIYNSDGYFTFDAFTDGAGQYTVDGLVPGTHFAVVEHARLNSELYDGIPCEDGCDPTSGTPIAVDLNATTSGIDFDLGYCTPTDTSLCVTGDRFRVEATWEDFEHVTGPGFAERLSTDAGYFWFFDPGNIEVVIKVLDVCVEPHNRFWVFGAGLTNVGVELKVTDELTGDVRTYTSPLGNPFVPVLDTQAFATCDAGLREASEPVAVPAPSDGLIPSMDVWQPPLQADMEPSAKATCTTDGTDLCLNADRFLVELVWEAPNGDGGSAQAVQLTGESGYFWFGSVDNVEVVVKVLDACNLAPFHNYWVFAAGLTNFEVTLRVTDTTSGEVQEYFNPQGRTFEAITDTGHFATCP